MDIKKLREAQGISQRELARRMGVASPSVIRWEKNTAYPSADKLPQLAEILCCTIDELFACAAS